MVILDTSILIDHIRRSTTADSYLVKFCELNPTRQLVISPISTQELYSGTSSKTSQKQRFAIAMISAFKILPYNSDVAKLAGEVVRDLGRPLGFPDAAIAATAILNKASLVTLNKKDFKGIKGLKLI